MTTFGNYNRTILITGAAGFIGSSLIKLILKSSEYNIIGIDNLNTYYDINLKLDRLKQIDDEKFKFYKIDLCDYKKIEKISEIYFKNLITFNFLMKDSIKLLKKLKIKYNLHIITNGFDKVQNKKINNSSLSFFFNSITTAEEAGFKKPNIEIFNFAMARANTKPSNSLMIGDSFDSDIIGSLNAGMKAIHFNSHAENDHNYCLVVESLSQLIELIDN